jgi:hypothetical protein
MVYDHLDLSFVFVFFVSFSLVFFLLMPRMLILAIAAGCCFFPRFELDREKKRKTARALTLLKEMRAAREDNQQNKQKSSTLPTLPHEK